MIKKFRKKYLLILIGFILPLFIWVIELFKDSVIGEVLISVLPLLLVLVTLSIIVYTLFLKKKLRKNFFYIYIFISLILLAPFYYKVINFYYSPNPRFSNETNSANDSIKIMSFNILYTNKDLTSTIELIKSEKPDIVFIYEMKTDQFEGLSTALYPDYAAYPSLADNGIFSRLNLNLNYENLILNNYSYRKVSLTFNESEYYIYGIHPAAPVGQKLRDDRDIYMENLIADINLYNSSNIIVVGDFNMTPWSYAYEDFMKRTNNVFTDIAQGNGYDDTWSPLASPFIGIDYIDHIWVNNKIIPISYKNLIVKGSDHKALIFNYN
jgi:endonuclease/exonuclease/phosphatase (EEP) superfamily protein YafD